MTKRQLINSFAEKNDITPKDSERLLNSVFRHIQALLLQGEEVRLGDIGKFTFKYLEPRVVQNNLQGRRHKVTAGIKLRFRPFPAMRGSLKELAQRSQS